MKTHIEFSIHFSPGAFHEGGWPWISVGEEKTYEQMLSMGLREKWRQHQGEHISKAVAGFEGEYGSDESINLLKFIEIQFGLPEKPHRPIFKAERVRFFCPKITRIYDKKDIQTAPLLRWAGAKAEIGTYLRQTDGEQWFMSPSYRLKNKFDAGFHCPFPALAVSGALKEALEERQLRGLEFALVQLETPSSSPKDIWRINSQLRMPSCLLPIQHQDGMPFSGDYAKGSLWDDAGTTPYELKFSFAAVSGMGVFDVALTQERTGMDASHAFRDIIISQKFRQVLERLRMEKKLKIPPLEFVPVRLVD